MALQTKTATITAIVGYVMDQRRKSTDGYIDPLLGLPTVTQTYGYFKLQLCMGRRLHRRTFTSIDCFVN